jgi:hypothetical protein
MKIHGLEWEDTTNYRRGDKDRKPSCWTAKFGIFRLTVLSGHIHYPGVWVARSDPFFSTRELNAKTRDEAMLEAMKLIWADLSQAIGAICEAGI